LSNDIRSTKNIKKPQKTRAIVMHVSVKGKCAFMISLKRIPGNYPPTNGMRAGSTAAVSQSVVNLFAFLMPGT